MRGVPERLVARGLRYCLWRRLRWLCLPLLCLTAPCRAADLVVQVEDASGRPVANAVVVATSDAVTAPVRAGEATIDQVDKEFVPYVSVVTVGTRVRFPNHDNIRHHVYSFSPGKVFDLPLYAGTAALPVTFDRPGVVVMGCNIHDWMESYLYVADSPWFGLTGKDGSTRVRGLAPASWRVRVWHPRLLGSERDTVRVLDLGASDAPVLRWVLDLGPDLRPRRAPVPAADGYR